VVGQAYTQPVNADPNDPRTWAPITITTTPAGTANGTPPSGAVGFNGGLPGQMPGLLPGQLPGQIPGQPAFPGQQSFPPVGMQTPRGFQLPGQPGFNPTQNQFKIDPNGQLVPIAPTQTGAVINSQTGGEQTTPTQGIQAPGLSPLNGVPAQNAATTAIQNMIMNPNPVAGAG
jgi:hypothetical protein